MTTKQTISIVIPAYNEIESLTATTQTLLDVLGKIKTTFNEVGTLNIIYVDDGSSDNTWSLINQLSTEYAEVQGIKLAHNAGHQHALLAGLTYAVKFSDAIITIDADLQDDPTKMVDMITDYLSGHDIVYGIRNDRHSDTWFKRTTANTFYRLINRIGVPLIPNHADYRLMSQRAVNALLAYPERNIFIRGIIPQIGYPSAAVYYKRTPRLAGTSKYPLKKMLAFAWDGVSSFSIAPLRLLFSIGLLVLFIGIVMTLYTLFIKATGMAVQGWSSLMISLWLIGGLQLAGLGILGEYIGKLTIEVKARPRFNIEADTNRNGDLHAENINQ